MPPVVSATASTRGAQCSGSPGRSTGSPDPGVWVFSPALETLPLRVKLAYAAPSFAGAAMVVPIGIHMTKFYADTALVPLGYLGLAIAVARAFDAVTDPLMGWLSDRTRSRWGRRRPWVLVGSLLCAGAFWLLFSPPASLSPTEGAAWFLVTYLLYFLFHPVYLVPYMAWGAELTLDYHERSALFGLREATLIAGTLCAAVLPGLFTSWLGEREAFRLFATIFGALLALLYGILAFTVPERREFQQRPSNPLVPGVRRALRNPPFRTLLFVSILGAIPGALSATLMPFFTEYVVRPEDPDRWLAIFLFAYFFSAFLFLLPWLWLARRAGKHVAMGVSVAVGATATLSMLAVGEGDATLFLACVTAAGASFGAITFLSLAMKADVIDYDELLTGRRREAQFSSFWMIVPKFVSVPAAAVPIAVLGALGYVPNQVQAPEVVTALRVLFAVVPAAAFALAFLLLLGYPITPVLHARIRAGIAARARGEPAKDPVSGAALAGRIAGSVDDETGWFLDHFSPRELRRVLAGGARELPRRTAAAALASAGVCIAAGTAAASAASHPTEQPGIDAVAAVVAAGIALAAAGFHSVRFAAARRLVRRPPAPEVVRAHLEGQAPRARLGAPAPAPAPGAEP